MTRSPFTLAVTSLKPHGGRTTTALALAWALGRSGRRVLLVDGNVYPSLLPSKTETGDAELWPGVIIGSRRPGEAAEVGADVVIIDAPPLTGKKVDRVLAAADTILLTVFPIVQNARFLPKAKEKLATIDTDKVLGWLACNVGDGNRHHADLVVDLETELGEYRRLGNVPAMREVSTWRPMSGADLPEGRLRDAYVELARHLEGRLESRDPSGQASPTSTRSPGAGIPAFGLGVDAQAAIAPATHHGETPVPAASAVEPKPLPRDLLPKAPPPQASAAPRFEGNHPVAEVGPSARSSAESAEPVARHELGARSEPSLLADSPTSSASIDRLLEDIDRLEDPVAPPTAVEEPPTHTIDETIEPEDVAVPEHVSVEVREPSFDGPEAPPTPDTSDGADDEGPDVAAGGPEVGEAPAQRATRWRLVSDRPLRLSLSLVPVEGHFEVGQHFDVLPTSTPSPALRAMLRFGLVHTVHRGRDDEATAETSRSEAESAPPRLRALQETRLPMKARNAKEDALLAACRALIEGDSRAALQALESGRKTDARFLAALLRLAEGEPHMARRHLVAAIRSAHRLGADLAQHGLAVLAAVELDHGVALHFGANLRGAHVCRFVAALMRGDAAETLAELNELVGLDPEDVLLRTLLVERLLGARESSEFDALHRASYPHDFQTRVHTALSYYRAVALHRMGLPEAAYLGLTEAIEAEGHRTDTLRHALLYERVQVAETLGRIQHVRRDLEVLFAEAPEYADVGVRLGLAA